VTEPDQDSDAPWLTLAEAAARSGRHIDAIRTMVRRGKLERRKGNAGQWLVRLPPNGMIGPDRSSDAASDAGGDAWLAEVVAELKEEVTELRVALARSEAGHDAALAQVKAEGETRAAKAEAELEASRTMLAQERARGDRLEAALAEARRPWLAKVLEGLKRKG
jgi:hypothetical protein